jgi:hypothetical protein
LAGFPSRPRLGIATAARSLDLVIPRPLLLVLVFALPVLVVAFAVILGAAQLAAAMGDAAGGRALVWVAIGTLILLVIDVLLLVGVLGLAALGADAPDDEPRE